MSLDERVVFAVVLVSGIILPGVADYALSAAGFDTLGMVVWAGGYLAMILYLWYRWIRPLDLTGPAGEGAVP